MNSQFFKPLGNGLILRATESDADVAQVAAINADIHGAEVGDIVRHWLFAGHPETSRRDWLFVQDETTGEAVATLGLLPTTWRYGAQPVPVAEMGMVATRPDYRGRGLQRALYDAFEQMALERGFTLSAIEGIPGFYGQFGYEYAVPLNAKVDIDLDQVSDVPASIDYETRPATVADTSVLLKLHDESIAELDLAALRGKALWVHQVSVPEGITFYGSTTALEHQGQVVGYLRWNDDEWLDRLRILELAVEEGPGMRERILVALAFAHHRAKIADKGGLRLDLPGNHPAVEVARHLGATDRGFYGWQIKVLDPIGFMGVIRPTLEARLAQSVLAGFEGQLVFDFHRSRLALRFENGRLVQVGAPSDEAQSHAGMTRKQATQLWLGWRGREALEAWHPDFWSRAEARHLLDVLFPAMRAFIYMPY